MNANKQILLKTFIILISVLAIISALIILVGVSDVVLAKITGLTFMLILASLTGSIGFVIYHRPEYQVLGLVTLIASGISFLINAALLFMGVTDLTSGGSGLFQAVFIGLISSIALGHVSFLFHINCRNKYARTARVIAVIFISLFSLLIMYSMTQMMGGFRSLAALGGGGQNEYRNAISAFLFIDLAATIAVPLCNRLNFPEEQELELTSPPVILETTSDTPVQ